MASDKTVLCFGPGRADPSTMVSCFAEERALELVRVDQATELRSFLNRTMPACVVMEAEHDSAEMVEVIAVLKADSFTSIVPLVVVLGAGDGGASALLLAGADEVLHDSTPEREKRLRLDQVLNRADRDVSVNPTTRLPGTNHIAGDMQARLETSEQFGVCYADLDHFKEFNDRYGYQFGDRVIRSAFAYSEGLCPRLGAGRVRGAHRWGRLHPQRAHGVLGGNV
jgi:PleD family two-component response regulator